MPHWSERLNAAAEEKHFTAVDVARLTGLERENVFKYFAGKVDHPRGDAIPKLAKALGKSASWLRDGTMTIDEQLHEVVEGQVRFVPVIGYVEAGVWREAHEIDPEERHYVPIQPTIPYAKQMFVVEARGTSMNKFYPEGTKLYCVRLDETAAEVRNGQHVIVMRRGSGGDTCEMTVKEYEKLNGTVKLWPRSTDPRYQEPIVYKDDQPDQDEVSIYAIVRHALMNAPGV